MSKASENSAEKKTLWNLTEEEKKRVFNINGLEVKFREHAGTSKGECECCECQDCSGDDLAEEHSVLLCEDWHEDCCTFPNIMWLVEMGVELP